MTINPLHLNGLMQRSQDVSAMKQNADHKPVVQQENIQVAFHRKTDSMVKTVVHPEDKANAQGHFDAKEEGKNKYFSNRKKQQPETKNQVKEKVKTVGFDVTI